MSRARGFGVALIGMVMVVAPAPAQEDAPRPRRERPARADRPEARRRLARRQNMEAFYQKLLKELALDETQQKAVKQAVDTFAQAAKNWQAEHGEELRALQQQIRQAGRENREKVQELRTKQQELTKGRARLREDLNTQIMDVLKDDQKAKFQELLREAGRPNPLVVLHRALGRLELSDEVKGKAAGILKKAKADTKEAKDAKAKADIAAKAVAEVKALLTDEQKAQLDRMLQPRRAGARARLPRGLSQLNLTEEQTKKIQEIMAAARQAEPENRRQAIREATRKVIGEVLTPAQREQWQKLRGGRRGRPRNRRDRGNSGGGEE